ncbi:asparagine-linked glycosylation protein [Xylographa opegraphella]|nr:asparagine-linked glycosylation protein [Xylographa opegraphella]
MVNFLSLARMEPDAEKERRGHNAAGGGERVLWAAIKATQERYPKAACIVYTGDVDVPDSETKILKTAEYVSSTDAANAMKRDVILEKVEQNFNIRLHHSSIHFKFLSTRDWLLASRYPYFTLLGQSLGSLRVAYDALSQFVPNVFIDTMGYSFVTAFARFVFPSMPIGAYVHYPTISTDMLGSLDVDSAEGLNAGTGKGFRGYVKRIYWHLFAHLYGWTGGNIDVVMTNSSWTKGHIQSLWGPSRSKAGKNWEVEVVFPPVSVEEIERAVDVSEASEHRREGGILYIAQFRPEKNHELVINAFAEFLNISKDISKRSSPKKKLVLLGSLRDDNKQDVRRVAQLRRLIQKLEIDDSVEFALNAPWTQMLDWLGKSSIGVNGMWNEHFGIGVVEYQAAGLVCVVNNSGGPKQDIVVDMDGGPTGFHASTASEYAEAFSKALSLSPKEALAMRRRARLSAKRFSEERFASRWKAQLDTLIHLQNKTLGH